MVSRSPKTRAEIVSQLHSLRRDNAAMVGLCLIVLLVGVAFGAPLIATHDPYSQDLSRTYLPPSREHLMGTDSLGRDLFSRIVYGARVSLLTGLLPVVIGIVFGGTLGLYAGFVGGRADTIVMRAMDILLAFPALMLAIMVVVVLGPGLTNAMIAIGVRNIPLYVRLVRASTLVAKNSEYVESARALGSSDARVALRHVLPNVLSPMVVFSTVQVGAAILMVSGLGFIGLGAQPPTPEWGVMLGMGSRALLFAPHTSVFPGLAISGVVLGVNLLGDGLRDALDPRLRK